MHTVRCDDRRHHQWEEDLFSFQIYLFHISCNAINLKMNKPYIRQINLWHGFDLVHHMMFLERLLAEEHVHALSSIWKLLFCHDQKCTNCVTPCKSICRQNYLSLIFVQHFMYHDLYALLWIDVESMNVIKSFEKIHLSISNLTIMVKEHYFTAPKFALYVACCSLYQSIPG